MASNLSERLAEAKGAPIQFGEVEVRAIYELRFNEDTSLNVTFQQSRKDRAQALRLRAESGVLIANGLELRDAAFWSDTAPQSFKVLFQPSGRNIGVVKMWNEWRDSSGVEHAWIGNAGMVVTASGNGVSLKCSDGVGVPSFEDLVVSIGIEATPRVVDFAAHRQKLRR